MGQIDGFIKFKRELPQKEEAPKRVQHFNEFVNEVTDSDIKEQSARCMDCGVAFCHSGCPLGNRIPDFNDAVYKNDWHKAYELLISTNNFPEFTGRICPAPCEGSCVLGINSDAVAIELIEKSIAERAFENGWVKPKIPTNETGKKVAVIGSGPSGLACADELRSQGHTVIVYEKSDRIGGLLRYGIPDFKLDKSVVERRVQLMKDAGIEFKTKINIGVDIAPAELMDNHDAVVLCIGSAVPRDLNIEGRQLKGVNFAMDFLSQVNKKVAGDEVEVIDCKGKDILVIGGGDTGSDCIGSSNRMKANSVTQLELLSKPPVQRSDDNPWPNWPMVLRTSSSHEEGAEREWSVTTKRFLSDDGVHLSGVETVNIKWDKNESGSYSMMEIEGTSKIIKCDLAFLAIGFVYPLLEGFLGKMNLSLDQKNNIKADNYHTSVDKVFAAGDARMGQSLVVHAIAEGRKVASAVNDYVSVKNKSNKKSQLVNPFAV